MKKFGIAAIVLAVFVTPTADAAAQTKTITLGVISNRSQAEVEPQYHDFVRYIARKLAGKSPVEGKVMAAATVRELEKLLEGGKVDFYMDSPYPTYLINSQGVAVPLLRRWKSGAAEYRGVVFTKKDSGANRVEELRGRMIALEDPGSTSGYFLPKVFLAGRGLKLAEKPSLDATVAPGEIGYIFAFSTARIVDLVLTRKVIAGAFSNEDYERLDPNKKAEIVFLGETENFPRNFLSIRKELDPEVAGRLQDILLSMHEDGEGRAILAKLENTTKFDLAPGGEQAVHFKMQEVFGPRP